MKQIKILHCIPLIFVLLFSSCGSDEDYEIGNAQAPSNLALTVVPMQDGSGNVEVSFSSDNAITHIVKFYNITDPNNIQESTQQITQSENTSQYLIKVGQSGQQTFKAIYYAFGVGGVMDSIETQFDIFTNFELPSEVVQYLTAGSSKTWYWDRNNAGHLGVGPPDGSSDSWYSAPDNSKPDCLYDDEIIFTLSGENISVEVLNFGQSFLHVDHQQNMVGQQDTEDACFDYTMPGSVSVNFAEATSGLGSDVSTQIQMTLGGGGFLSYGLETNEYEILSISDQELYVRTLETAPDGSLRAWYQRFVSSAGEAPTCAGSTGASAGTGDYVLVWEEEFMTDGAPCDLNWTYDLGDGGWGNGEAQTYTNSSDNVYVQDGSLFIVAKSDPSLGYTSARLKTQDLFEFTYGKVEVRAKLPTEGGTWPAIWTLGANFPDVGWPACGEIDIMEHTGNNANTIINALHNPDGSQNTPFVNYSTVSDASEFHVYSIEWDQNEIKFFTDDVLTYTYDNVSNWSYSADQFLILNIAMGGTLGGTIDPNFTSATMEVDYVKVFQK